LPKIWINSSQYNTDTTNRIYNLQYLHIYKLTIQKLVWVDVLFDLDPFKKEGNRYYKAIRAATLYMPKYLLYLLTNRLIYLLESHSQSNEGNIEGIL